jgi:hypothetical protein
MAQTAADLAKMPRSSAKTLDDGVEVTYEGVLLSEILKRAGAVNGKDLRGKALASYLLGQARDGYRVVFSLAEFDPEFNDKPILVADTRDGRPLFDYQGPFRLVAAKEKRGARSIRMLSKLTVVCLPERRVSLRPNAGRPDRHRGVARGLPSIDLSSRRSATRVPDRARSGRTRVHGRPGRARPSPLSRRPPVAQQPPVMRHVPCPVDGLNDGCGRAIGSAGEVHPRGSMSLAHVAYASALTWGEPTVHSLEVQARTPLNPVELGWAEPGDDHVARLKDVSEYRELSLRPQGTRRDAQKTAAVSVRRVVPILHNSLP